MEHFVKPVISLWPLSLKTCLSLKDSTGWKVIYMVTFSIWCPSACKGTIWQKGTYGGESAHSPAPSQPHPASAAVAAPLDSEPQLHCGSWRKEGKKIQLCFLFQAWEVLVHYYQNRTTKTKQNQPVCVDCTIHMKSGFHPAVAPKAPLH